MEMNLDFESIGALFELSRDAVLGLNGRTVVFANPCAEELLGARVGMDAEALLPSHILASNAERFIASARINGQTADVSVLRQGDRRLIACCPREQAELSPAEGSVRVFSDALSGLRLSLDAVISRCDAEKEPRLHYYAAVLYRQYYSLLRLCSHLSLSANLKNGSLPLALQVVELDVLGAALFDSVAKLCAKPLGIAMEYHCEPGLYLTTADPDLLEVMILNLLTNSLQCLTEGGTLQLSLQRHGSRFVFSVADNGPGIDSSKLSRLLDSGAQLKTAHNGAGLGLSIARGIAELHGGSILLESRPGQGSTVRVILPQRDASETELRQRLPRYGDSGMSRILAELSPALPTELYHSRLMD